MKNYFIHSRHVPSAKNAVRVLAAVKNNVENRFICIALQCCNNGNWHHKSCLRKMAFDLRDSFKCPSCDDVKIFREKMLYNGIFIPASTEKNNDKNNEND